MKHPNAAAGLVSASGGGALVIWLLSLVGVQVDDPYVATSIAGGIVAVALLIGHKGIVGLARMIWRGADAGP